MPRAIDLGLDLGRRPKWIPSPSPLHSNLVDPHDLRVASPSEPLLVPVLRASLPASRDMSDLRTSLGRVIYTRRRELGLTQRRLADRARIANATVSKIEQCKLSPTIEMLAKIAAGLDLELVELIELVVPRRAASDPER
ncbi:MAG: helix-turn-helix transcriptional regulator [Deltaproteobacteria bacterium]|nr:helix-turn-helix transcriptional regulator [Deltaproteobacteria bacterium]